MKFYEKFDDNFEVIILYTTKRSNLHFTYLRFVPLNKYVDISN